MWCQSRDAKEVRPCNCGLRRISRYEDQRLPKPGSFDEGCQPFSAQAEIERLKMRLSLLEDAVADMRKGFAQR